LPGENLGRIPIFIAISAICAILLSSSFGTQINQGAWAGTFPGENGKIAFSSQRDGDYYEIYVMDADGSNPTRLTNNASLDSYPSWSPDGTKIAFVSGRDTGGAFQIYVMDADGSGLIRLSNGIGEDAHPSWSPDGTKIAFASTKHGAYEIYVMDADGSNPTRLTNNPGWDDTFPSWSPDGTKIAFGKEGATLARYAKMEIYVMDADGSNPTKLTNKDAAAQDASSDTQPSWSPDGTKIAFASNRDGNFEIYVMNADGSNQTNLSNNNNATDAHPSWSPDGTKIAFFSARHGGGAFQIYVMDADGSGQKNISNNLANDYFPDWGTASAAEPPEEDTTPPTLTVPEDIVVEATGEQGAEVTYTVTAEDNVDGSATLEEDGTTVTQDDVGGDVTISCDPPSGSVFPIGDTEVECSATDEAGNTGTASFTVTVNPPSPLTPAQEVIDELISTIQNLDDNVPQDVKTSLIAVLNEVLNILNDNNPNNDESACGTLDAFINQVNANETSDTLTADDADELSTQGEDIRNALNC
jgi:Tol biopolymer transport system component